MKVIAYRRVSTEDQSRSGLGMDAQRTSEDVERWVADLTTASLSPATVRNLALTCPDPE